MHWCCIFWLASREELSLGTRGIQALKGDPSRFFPAVRELTLEALPG
jgi:hypothetical protein